MVIAQVQEILVYTSRKFHWKIFQDQKVMFKDEVKMEEDQRSEQKILHANGRVVPHGHLLNTHCPYTIFQCYMHRQYLSTCYEMVIRKMLPVHVTLKAGITS